MATLLQAIQLAERLEKSHIKVLKWFIQNGNFEGSYRELAENIYGNAKYASNVHGTSDRCSQYRVQLL